MSAKRDRRRRRKPRHDQPREEFIRSDGVLGVRLYGVDKYAVYGDKRHWLPADRERAAAWLLERRHVVREGRETAHDAAYRVLFG